MTGLIGDLAAALRVLADAADAAVASLEADAHDFGPLDEFGDLCASLIGKCS
ncbi:hypothetical protein [Actinokineospora pegani]|uniref:hypothetical protein n=1 Tax=Actinokineospora pegani TaxID=2654637 RepID=UPI0018D42340|nr:hypothetical protein [Actinokineospora pegani]